MVFLKEFFEQIEFEKKSADDKKHEKLPRRQRINEIRLFFLIRNIQEVTCMFPMLGFVLNEI